MVHLSAKRFAVLQRTWMFSLPALMTEGSVMWELGSPCDREGTEALEGQESSLKQAIRTRNELKFSDPHV